MKGMKAKCQRKSEKSRGAAVSRNHYEWFFLKDTGW